MDADPRDTLLTLIADALGTLDAWGAAGVEGVPRGEISGLGAPPTADPVALPSSVARPTAPRSPPPPAAPRTPPPPAVPVAPRAQVPPIAPAPARAQPPERVEPVRPAVPAPTPIAPPPAPAGDGGGLFAGKWSAYVEDPVVLLDRLLTEARACGRCGRCTTRRQVVAGGGAPRSALLVLTPPPSAAEEAVGAPLIGEAGAMFDRMLINVLALERADVQVSPVLLCAGGAATREELDACRLWLERRIELVKPRAILILGPTAAAALGAQRTAVGRWQSLFGVDTLVSLHPDQLLQEPARKREVFEHLKELRARIG